MSFSDFLNCVLDDPELWPAYIAGIFGGLLFGFLPMAFGFICNSICELLFVIRNRSFKKSGKLTIEQRLDLLEEKIDSLADIVISSSEEV